MRRFRRSDVTLGRAIGYSWKMLGSLFLLLNRITMYMWNTQARKYIWGQITIDWYKSNYICSISKILFWRRKNLHISVIVISSKLSYLCILKNVQIRISFNLMLCFIRGMVHVHNAIIVIILTTIVMHALFFNRNWITLQLLIIFPLDGPWFIFCYSVDVSLRRSNLW